MKLSPVSITCRFSLYQGGEALVSCGMMESLLKVIKWPGEDEQIHTTVSVVLWLCNVAHSLHSNHVSFRLAEAI